MGSQFEPTEHYTNEQCGKSKHLFLKIFSDSEDISTVTNYKFLVLLITNDSYTNDEGKKRISLSKPAIVNLTKIIKILEGSTNTKIKLLETQSFQ